MPIDFSIPADADAYRRKVRRFVAEAVVPAEKAALAGGVDDALRLRLQDLARAAGVFAPQAPAAFGGGGTDFLTTALLLEEAGYSPLGPLAMNCAAPDEGNMHLLSLVGSPAQQQRHLRPLVAGRARSCFAMTEPPPGAGSDPSALATIARRRPDGWLIEGEKIFISGADGAAFAIVMARAEGGDAPGATMFLVDADNPGWRVTERIRTIDTMTVGGHCRVELRDLFVGDDAVLGEPGRGLAHAQARLVPARLTHCMRWLGLARRAHDLALRRAGERSLFGATLGTLGMAQQLIADNEIDIAASRALLWQTVWQVAQGGKSTEESSRAKVFISEATGRVVDRAVQLAGGWGITEDSVIGRIYAEIRAFRIYDGPSEAHRAAIARRALARAQRPAS
ncbi:MAG: acyl-CoA dehydrogenase [Micromonosporaceae bacterium]|nr:acyl-CoA dehydrogenase [Micromonosporaceae bacterium]